MTKHASIGTPRMYGHEKCRFLDDSSGSVGSVRVCPHGKIMYCFQQGGHVDNIWYGHMHSFWFQLHPVFTPFLYRRAKRALD